MFRPFYGTVSALIALATLALAACAPGGEPRLPASPAPEPATAPALQPATAPAPARTSIVTPRTPTFVSLARWQGAAKAYERVELAIDTDGAFANPFDPGQADLSVSFTSPSGKVATVPAFWYQEFDPATLRPTGVSGWRARFTPTVAGEWHAQASLARPALRGEPIVFAVADNPDARGFVRVDKANPRYFAFDDGEPYLPIGANVAWAGSLDSTIADYERCFGGLSDNGGNVARVWMASWSVGIEWKDTGLGDYSKRMKQAYLLDQIFRVAEQKGIYVMLTLLNHGAFSQTVNPEWADNPYSAANGGMLAGPAQFATSPQAKELFKRRVRYIAARWGYATNLFAWEWWNEENWTPIDDAALFPWIQELTPYLRGMDPNRHLVSSSYSDGSASGLWKLPEIDFAQQHDYSGNDPSQALRASYRALLDSAPGKPALLAEHGYSANGADAQGGREAIHFHNGIWAPPFLGYAGTGMSWWWDTFIDPQGLWKEYRPLAEFMRGERLAGFKPGLADAGPNAYALVLRGSARNLAWVRHKEFDARAAQRAYGKALLAGTAGPDWTYEPAALSRQTLTIKGLRDGDYTAYWFSPQTGEWLSETPARVQGGAVDLAVPEFSRDLAVKLLGANEPRTP